MSKDFKEIVVSRLVNAPVETVWTYWTVPEKVQKWWGPDIFSCPSAQLDFREGGTSLVCMHSPDYGYQYNTWLYTSIVPLQRIEYVQNLTDEKGQPIDPVTVGMPADFPRDVVTVVTFEAVGEKTQLTVTQTMPYSQILQFAILGLNQTIDKLVRAVGPN